MDDANQAWHAQVRRVFEQALDAPTPERRSVVERACAGDERLKAEVLALLEAARDTPFLSQITADVATGPRSGAWVEGRAQERAGDAIDRYRLLEPIGEGGFGTVWMAEQTEPVRRHVALKLIKVGMDTKRVIARFELERQALALMDHPNIARVLDAGSTQTGRPYFVMELVRGPSITEYCDQKRLPIRERLELMLQVCDALQHAHQKGIIHRDIKPSNVLVSQVGDKALPKVIDFGIAKATSAHVVGRTVFTEFRQMIGTPAYMSPEQAGESSGDLDTRTDVYSAGVLLYELITGSTPFDPKDLASAAFGEIQRLIREVDPPKPSTRLAEKTDTLPTVASDRRSEPGRLRTSLRGDLDWIVMKALEKDRARRYESAGAMARDIERYLGGQVIDAAPPSAAYRARKFVRRHKVGVLAGSLLGLSILGGLVGTSAGFMKASAQRAEAESQRDAATAARLRADENAERAADAEAVATRRAYTASMLLASNAASNLRRDLMIEGLVAAPPALRGWEWRVLNARLDTSIRSVPTEQTDPSASEDLGVLPDGRSFLTFHRAGRAWATRWDARTGAPRTTYRHESLGDTDEPRGTAFTTSSDGTRLWAWRVGTAESPAVVVGWDVESGEPVASAAIAHEETAATGAVLSHDGARLACFAGRQVWVRRVADGQVLARAETDIDPVHAWFSPDDARLVLTSAVGGLALLEGDALVPREMERLHGNICETADFSADGRWLVTGARDSRAILWDLDATPPIGEELPHPHPVTAARFSPDGSFLATTCGDTNLRVWDVASADLRGVFQADALVGGSLMVLPDSRTIAARQRDGTVRFWDTTALDTIRLRHRGLIQGGVAFADGAGLIVSAGWDGRHTSSPGCIRFWDSRTGEQVASLGVPTEIARFLTASPAGNRAAAYISHNPGTARVVSIDLRTGRVIDVPGLAIALAFDPSEQYLALGRLDGAEIRGASDGSLLGRVSGDIEGASVSRVEWSPDGRLLLLGWERAGGERGLAIADAQTRSVVRTLPDASAFFSSDARRLITRQPDGVAIALDTTTWESRPASDAEAHPLGSLPSPDGARLATLGDMRVDIWDAATRDRVAVLDAPGWISRIAWNADGSALAIANGWQVDLWDATPLRDRLAAREAAASAREIIAPLVARWFDEFGEPERVLERLDAETSLSEVQRRVARFEVFRRGLEQSQATPRS